MSIISYIKLLLLNGLLCWYRKTFTEDVEDVITPLDEVINQTARLIEADEERTLCRKHYFAHTAFVNCPDCGFSSPGVISK